MPMARCLAILLAAATLAWRPLPAAAYQVQSGIGFLAVTGATVGATIALEDAKGTELQRGTADAYGSLIFRELKQGGRYVIHDTSPGGTDTPVTVRRFKDRPDPALYTKQTLVDGYQYIETRDGTLLAAMIRPPAGKKLSDGPFPAVVEYSGYNPADPDNPPASALIASFLGFATVGVNMRGSGCSGGVFDLFDLPITADGYDIIEAIAAQPWVKGGKVGMVGISFPGISQLFVGGSRPPHLAAIAPLSTIEDIYRAPGFPGGMFNDGFAKSWLRDRKSDAEPAPAGGQPWARKRVNDGDTVCLANQTLRLQTLDPISFTELNPFYIPSLMDPRSPINWVSKIKVPVFYSASFQDEQTGPDFAFMLNRFPNRPDVKITMQNGVHTSSLDPAVLWNWLAFLDIYVAKIVPDMSFLATIAPVIYPQILGAGTPTPPLPTDRFKGITDYAQAKKLFESDPHVLVHMENGAGSPNPGIPAPTFDLAFKQWPAPQVKPTALYFGPGGTLVPTKGGAAGTDTYHPDPSVRPRRSWSGMGSEWDPLPDYTWVPLVDGTALAYATPVLDQDVVIAGPSSVDLWLGSSAQDTDIQVTLTEIRPDGLEYYVQNGFLRASHRKLDKKTSTILSPRATHLEKDAQPMPAGGASTRVSVELYSVAHVFRKGSRIRLSIEAPGGDRTSWTFDTPLTNGAVANMVAYGGKQPSRIVLPVIPGVAAPAALPPCPGLRGQPCRTYAPAANGG
jgi:predicted acyl esterase